MAAYCKKKIWTILWIITAFITPNRSSPVMVRQIRDWNAELSKLALKSLSKGLSHSEPDASSKVIGGHVFAMYNTGKTRTRDTVKNNTEIPTSLTVSEMTEFSPRNNETKVHDSHATYKNNPDSSNSNITNGKQILVNGNDQDGQGIQTNHTPSDVRIFNDWAISLKENFHNDSKQMMENITTNVFAIATSTSYAYPLTKNDAEVQHSRRNETGNNKTSDSESESLKIRNENETSKTVSDYRQQPLTDRENHDSDKEAENMNGDLVKIFTDSSNANQNSSTTSKPNMFYPSDNSSVVNAEKSGKFGNEQSTSVGQTIANYKGFQTDIIRDGSKWIDFSKGGFMFGKSVNGSISRKHHSGLHDILSRMVRHRRDLPREQQNTTSEGNSNLDQQPRNISLRKTNNDKADTTSTLVPSDIGINSNSSQESLKNNSSNKEIQSMQLKNNTKFRHKETTEKVQTSNGTAKSTSVIVNDDSKTAESGINTQNMNETMYRQFLKQGKDVDSMTTKNMLLTNKNTTREVETATSSNFQGNREKSAQNISVVDKTNGKENITVMTSNQPSYRQKSPTIDEEIKLNENVTTSIQPSNRKSAGEENDTNKNVTGTTTKQPASRKPENKETGDNKNVNATHVQPSYRNADGKEIDANKTTIETTKQPSYRSPSPDQETDVKIDTNATHTQPSDRNPAVSKKTAANESITVSSEQSSYKSPASGIKIDNKNGTILTTAQPSYKSPVSDIKIDNKNGTILTSAQPSYRSPEKNKKIEAIRYRSRAVDKKTRTNKNETILTPAQPSYRSPVIDKDTEANGNKTVTSEQPSYKSSASDKETNVNKNGTILTSAQPSDRNRGKDKGIGGNENVTIPTRMGQALGMIKETGGNKNASTATLQLPYRQSRPIIDGIF